MLSIPKGWQSLTIEDACTLSSGTTPARDQYDRYYKNGTTHWVKTLDLNNSVLRSTEECVTEKALEETSLKVYPPGTVLVAMYGGYNQIGRTGLLEISAAVNQAITALQPAPSKINSSYLLAYLNYKIDYWKTVASSSRKDPNITSADVRAFPIVCPPIEEQRAIASALSDMDALLAKLDQLIAKKRDIKQAAMQELLTGRRRLPGFSAAWVAKRIDKVAPLQRGFDLTHSEVKPGPYPVAYSNGIANHHAEFKAKGPGIATGRSGTIGNVHYIESDYWPHNTSLFVTNFHGNDPKFVYYLFQHTKLAQFSTGSGVPTLNRNDVHAHVVQIPQAHEEQSAIAQALTDMDTEITALEARREKNRLIKQGMMQELLSGRVRLI